MDAEIPIDFFPALQEIFGLRHAFLGRAKGVDVKVDRNVALDRLNGVHQNALRTIGFDRQKMITGEQVHGNQIAVVNAATQSPVAGVDGLITNSREVCLGIYVADCCSVYLVEPAQGVIALLHSGRKGTDLGITTAAIQRMVNDFRCDPDQIVVQLSPCIRPPHYEIDIAAEIVRQCQAAGVGKVFDCGVCTATNLDRYYSYRAEKGMTGRMLALFALNGLS